jgi:hypothetical protein
MELAVAMGRTGTAPREADHAGEAVPASLTAGAAP